MMGPDELVDFEARTFAQWDRASLGDLRRSSAGGENFLNRHDANTWNRIKSRAVPIRT
jgi:hypothetical protein